MKRKILLVAALLSIVAGIVFTGLAYAAPPSDKGSTSKLVGVGLVGYATIGLQGTRWETRILISNPHNPYLR
jgi:hypothetical protein